MSPGQPRRTIDRASRILDPPTKADLSPQIGAPLARPALGGPHTSGINAGAIPPESRATTRTRNRHAAVPPRRPHLFHESLSQAARRRPAKPNTLVRLQQGSHRSGTSDGHHPEIVWRVLPQLPRAVPGRIRDARRAGALAVQLRCRRRAHWELLHPWRQRSCRDGEDATYQDRAQAVPWALRDAVATLFRRGQVMGPAGLPSRRSGVRFPGPAHPTCGPTS